MTVVTQDGTLVRGKIAKVDADVVTLTGERPNTSTEITRTSIAEVKRVEADKRAPPPRRSVRTVTIPDNTVLDVTLEHRAGVRYQPRRRSACAARWRLRL